MTAEETIRQLKNMGIIIPEEDAVKGYLEEYEDMQPLVLDVAEKSKRAFPQEEKEDD